MTPHLKKHFFEIFFGIVALFFSLWLMWHTFAYENGYMLIASKAWSDFASHVPLIRSFSQGDNWPPEYPLFPGEPLRYHFLFYLLVGLLEKLGFPLDWALNLPSALSFALLVFAIYFLGRELFKSRAVGIFSVVFFLFNGSFSFLEFFKTHPLSLHTFSDIFQNSTFPSFGPYDGKIVSAFWNLNIYTNQRHLALPLALLLLLVLWIIKVEKKVSIPQITLGGIFLGILPLAHSSIFIMAVGVLGMLFILLKRQKITVFGILIVGVLLSLPRVIFLKSSASFIPQLEIGFLTPHPVTLLSFLNYWFFNLGLAFILTLIGFILAPKTARQVFVAFLPLFLIGNLVQFSIEMAGNHKFFTVFVAIANMFAAYGVVKIWHQKVLGKTLAIVLVFFLTLSGVIDFFAVKNDRFYQIADYPQNPDVAWIVQNTPKNAIFLNSNYLYDPASLAGRKVFLGWPYFPWSLSYNTTRRDRELRDMLSANNVNDVCKLVTQNNISYIEIQHPDTNPNFTINYDLFKKNFKQIYNNPQSRLSLFTVQPVCNNLST
ncbi:MAG: hypothetical protein HYW33_02145 [Candidatus Blackburnbacteria bacterium]|nr:hypothetical protein [Candidatus Blackburnbacteria bacterium]